MRHPERELKTRETITAMLGRSLVGRIATVNQKGFPVIKPVNFVYLDGRIYFHSSAKGEKIEDIQRGSPVCFEVDEPIAYAVGSASACQASYYYRSILIKGKAALVEGRDKKVKILERMMEKYQPERNKGEMPEEILGKTAVIEVLIKEITGKENLG
ncbi:MAG TPA: pyridoxamine 5'-phosphate oxidase family protein [Thermodesulfobacteriota bacterium]|nr:pyridoxamine 5'-phosphate oxidase family protein [Thermodesulfobacteriota bacterium]